MIEVVWFFFGLACGYIVYHVAFNQGTLHKRVLRVVEKTHYEEIKENE